MRHLSSYSLAFFLANSTATALFGTAIHTQEPSECQSNTRHYRVSARHIEKGGIGYYQGYSTLEGFFASNPEKLTTIPFLDIRGHVFNDGKMAANGGFGFRTVAGKRTYGLNAYYDYRNTQRLHYNQVGLGFETLGTFWDFRINGYLPLGKKLTSPYNVKFNRFSGHSAYLYQKRQFAMKGINADFGFHFGKSKNFDYYATLGPYYFIGKVSYPIWGAKGRLSVKYKDYIQLEISNSYDRMFRNRFQGQITFSLPFGSKARREKSSGKYSCKTSETLISRMVQPVIREEIIVVGKGHQNHKAIDPFTGKPYYFVFVDNTSSSLGTYESPYHSFNQAQDNSSINDILYVFPGDGTTKGMDSGIILKDYQKLWGAGLNHFITTSQGMITIPAMSQAFPRITNTNVDTLGDAITLAENNQISGLNISSALHDGIYGSEVKSLEVSDCIFENNATFILETVSSANSSIILNNNTFQNNVGGLNITSNDSSSVVCKNNLFKGQTSISNVPIDIVASNSSLNTLFENNVFDSNTAGSIRLNLLDLNTATITAQNNTFVNNQIGSQGSLGSNFVVIPTGTIGDCNMLLTDNVFSLNQASSIVLHTSGKFNNLNVTASKNTMSQNGGSALVLSSPVDTLTCLAENNTIKGGNDNGISLIAASLTSRGTVIIKNNSIANIGNASNGIAINQDFSILNLSILNNYINDCEGTGILSYPPTGIDSINLNISGNTISNCQNLGFNLASGLDLEQYSNISGMVTNNTLSDNLGVPFYIGSNLPSPNVCFMLTGNKSTDYYLSNPLDGTFNVSPINPESVNVGTIIKLGTIDYVNSCPVTFKRIPE